MTVFESTHLLVLHDKIIAVVEAKNLIGFSTPSAENVLGPVLLQTVPHKPPTPPTNGANTSHLQLHVEWNALQNDNTGGTAILEYELQWDEGHSTAYVALHTADVLQHTTTNVSETITYKLIYRARNIYGWGPVSDSVSILVASVPSQILNPVITSMNGVSVKFEWLLSPDANGADVTAYRIKF